jgi:hypothetical protein
VDQSTSNPAAADRLRCDFCGELVPSVRRVALDEGYERLRTPHQERYACPDCSEQKDEDRRGLGR